MANLGCRDVIARTFPPSLQLVLPINKTIIAMNPNAAICTKCIQCIQNSFSTAFIYSIDSTISVSYKSKRKSPSGLCWSVMFQEIIPKRFFQVFFLTENGKAVFRQFKLFSKKFQLLVGKFGKFSPIVSDVFYSFQRWFEDQITIVSSGVIWLVCIKPLVQGGD